MITNNSMLQNHSLSNILELQGKILKLKGGIHEIVHNHVDSFMPIEGIENSQEQLKPLCEVTLGRPFKMKDQFKVKIVSSLP